MPGPRPGNGGSLLRFSSGGRLSYINQPTQTPRGGDPGVGDVDTEAVPSQPAPGVPSTNGRVTT
jgi:hypothetical protein